MFDGKDQTTETEGTNNMSVEKMRAVAEAPGCDITEVHADKVKYLHDEMPDEDKLYDLAELFKAFGDSTRIRILFALFKADICVCDLAESLGMTQSAISHQLRLLKQARLVSGRREGKQIIYYLADEHVRTIISMGMEHINE
jgi:ArsR family transcriptional regulator